MHERNYNGLADQGRRTPGSPSPATVWRWITRGCLGEKLEAVRFGERWFTCDEWMEDFGRRVAKSSKATHHRSDATPVAPRTDTQRRHDVERAKRACQAAGI